jgi:TfoX/Sxy family transcriptional regulator of competence genes
VAYDEELANRVRELLADERAVSEMPMFGGLAFLLHGNMSVAVSSQGGLLVRVGPQESDAAAGRPHASLMQMGKRQMTGWIRVAPEGVRSKRELNTWVQRGVGFARTLPPKGAKGRPRRRA